MGRPVIFTYIYLYVPWTLNEDVFPIENGDFPASHVSLLEGNHLQVLE